MSVQTFVTKFSVILNEVLRSTGNWWFKINIFHILKVSTLRWNRNYTLILSVYIYTKAIMNSEKCYWNKMYMKFAKYSINVIFLLWPFYFIFLYYLNMYAICITRASPCKHKTYLLSLIFTVCSRCLYFKYWLLSVARSILTGLSSWSVYSYNC